MFSPALPPLPRRARVAPSCSHAHSQAQSPPHVPVPMARSASDRPAQARQCGEGRQWARHARCRRRRSWRLSAGTGVCTAALVISALRRSRGKLPLSAPLTAGPAHGDGDVRAATPCSSRAPSVSAGSPRVVRVRLMAMNHPRAQQSVTSVTPACLLHPARCGNPGVTVSRSPVRGTGSGPGSSAEGNRCRELMTDVLITQSPREGRRREPPPPPGGGPRRLRVLPNPRALQCGP